MIPEHEGLVSSPVQISTSLCFGHSPKPDLVCDILEVTAQVQNIQTDVWGQRSKMCHVSGKVIVFTWERQCQCSRQKGLENSHFHVQMPPALHLKLLSQSVVRTIPSPSHPLPTTSHMMAPAIEDLRHKCFFWPNCLFLKPLSSLVLFLKVHAGAQT